MSVCIVGCACVINCHQTVSWGRYSGEMDTLKSSASVFTPLSSSSTASARRESCGARVVVIPWL